MVITMINYRISESSEPCFLASISYVQVPRALSSLPPIYHDLANRDFHWTRTCHPCCHRFFPRPHFPRSSEVIITDPFFFFVYRLKVLSSVLTVDVSSISSMGEVYKRQRSVFGFEIGITHEGIWLFSFQFAQLSR